MSKSSETRDVYTCDGCGKGFIMEEGDIPEGFHGTAREISDGCGNIALEWFACKRACIKAAVMDAIERAMNPFL